MPELLAILKDINPQADMENHTALIDDGVLVSLDIITLVAEIDDKIGVSIPAEEILPENFNSYKALSDLVQRLLDD
jgi:acyl carrier protein